MNMTLRIGWVIAACGFWLIAALSVTPLARAQTPAQLDNPVAALSLDGLSATRERPLFSPSRRGPSARVVAIARPAPVPAPAPPPSIELYGTILDANDALAIVFVTATNQVVRVHIGEEVGGWKVVQIDERKLVLSLEGRTAVFTMFADKPADAASPAAQDAGREETPEVRHHRKNDQQQ